MKNTKALVGRTVETEDGQCNTYTSTIQKVTSRNGKVRLHCEHPHGYGFTLVIDPEEIDQRVN